MPRNYFSSQEDIIQRDVGVFQGNFHQKYFPQINANQGGQFEVIWGLYELKTTKNDPKFDSYKRCRFPKLWCNLKKLAINERKLFPRRQYKKMKIFEWNLAHIYLFTWIIFNKLEYEIAFTLSFNFESIIGNLKLTIVRRIYVQILIFKGFYIFQQVINDIFYCIGVRNPFQDPLINKNPTLIRCFSL